MRKNSLTHKLVLTIVIPVIAVLMFLGILNYWDTKGILKQLNSAEQDYTLNEIRSFIELQFVALDIIEEPIQSQMETYSKKIISEYYSDSIESINLEKVRDALNMDAAAYDLYIINSSGKVVNTTYHADLGINLFNFGEVYKIYLQQILSEGKFDSPKFFFEDKTKKYKKYSYQATPDKKYIIEIGLYSNQADRIFDYMMNHLERIAKERKYLSEIDLFFWLEKPTSLNPDKEFFDEHLNELTKLERDSTLSLQHSNKDHYTYTYVKNINSKLIKGAIVRLKHEANYQSSFKKNELLKFSGVLLVALLLVIAIAFLIKPIGSVINKITHIAKELAIGNLSVTMDPELKNRKDELGDLSTAIGTLIEGLVQTSGFARQTGKGNFDEKYTLLSDKDELGKTLMKMQERLTRAKKEEEKNSKEDQKNKFIATGLAKFGDVLRSNNDDIEKLCYQTILNLVNYLKIPMGAIFVAEEIDNEIFLEPKATIAYDRLKIQNSKIKIGDGLVGRCAFERLPIYIKEIPQDYVHITTGLGTANPSFILLIPLLYENKVFGVIELASFNEIEDYQADFTKKLAESIASTLSSVQLNERTTVLLEQSKRQGEDLAMQEEQMRQNMEELIAGQEEAMVREDEANALIKAFEDSIFKTEYDITGKILDVNDKYLNFLNIRKDQLINANHKLELKYLSIKASATDHIWAKLNDGNAQEIKLKANINGNKNNIQEHYWSINNGTKILKVSYVCK